MNKHFFYKLCMQRMAKRRKKYPRKCNFYPIHKNWYSQLINWYTSSNLIFISSLQNKVIPTTQMPTTKRRDQLTYWHVTPIGDTRDTYITRLNNHKLSHKTHKTVPSEDIFAERNFNLIKIISTYRSALDTTTRRIRENIWIQ